MIVAVKKGYCSHDVKNLNNRRFVGLKIKNGTKLKNILLYIKFLNSDSNRDHSFSSLVEIVLNFILCSWQHTVESLNSVWSKKKYCNNHSELTQLWWRRLCCFALLCSMSMCNVVSGGGSHCGACTIIVYNRTFFMIQQRILLSCHR